MALRSSGFFNFGFQSSNSQLVLKLAPNHWLMADVVSDNGKPVVKRLIHAPLPRQVDPNRPNVDLEVLQETLAALVDQHGFVGRDVTILLPSSCSEVHTHAVPFDLTKRTDINEFQISANEREFWQEFEPDVQYVKLPTFDSQYIAPGLEASTSQVVVSWADQELLMKYIDLALSARMQPVALVPELQGVLNLLIPQLSRLDREGYFGLLHLARGRNKFLAVGPERIASANVNISELDEELLDEIESVDDVTNAFWGEVGERVGSALKQAILYLREQEGIPPIRNIYVISEETTCHNMLTLIGNHFTLGALRQWRPLDVLSKHKGLRVESASNIQNQTVWASLIGGGLQKLKPTRLAVPDGELPRFQLNLHPQRNQLSRNRQFKAVAKTLNVMSIAAVVLFGVWVTADFGVDFFQLQTSSQQVKSDLNALDSKQHELNQMNSAIQSAESQIASLVKADVVNAKSKFVMTLPSLLPNGVELSSMSVNDSTISLTGVALTNVGPQAFLNNIANSRLIKAPLLEVNRAESGKITFKIEGATGMVN